MQLPISIKTMTTMTSREIAELTGSSHDNVLKTVRALVEKGVVSGNDTPYTHPQNGQTYSEFHLSYRDTMVVVSGYSVELRARIIDRWQELEAAQALENPYNPNAPTKQYVDAAAAFIKHVTEDLKLAQSSVLGMYQKLEVKIGLQGLLSAYAVDASTSSVAGSSDRTAALGTLLKQFSVSMSAVSFNKLLVREGFLAEHTRPSSKGGTKNFKAVTNLEFGKNITNPANPRETQPHWYVDKFPSLLEALHVEFA